MPTASAPPRRLTGRVGGNGAHRPEPLRPPPTHRRRNTSAALAAVLCIAGGALAGVITFKAGSGRQSVLAASQNLSAGHILTASDLRVVDVSTDGGLNLVLSGAEASILGRPVAVAVASGAPVVQSDLGSPAAAGPGQAVVGVLCKAGQFPPSLAPGDTVEIIDTGAGAATGTSGPTSASAASSAPVGLLTATVLGVDAPTDTATVGMVVSLRVSTADAPSVARAAAAGRISLVLISPGG